MTGGAGARTGALAAARLLAALAAGALFGFGLSLSGMVDPTRVRGFLDVTGDWDPTLAFVLAGAVGAALPGYRLVLRRRRPLLAERFDLPTSRRIDGRLIGGSALFGVGWGLAGFCPGPAVTALSFAGMPALLFVLAMLAGMMLHDRTALGRLGTSRESASRGEATGRPGRT